MLKSLYRISNVITALLQLDWWLEIRPVSCNLHKIWTLWPGTKYWLALMNWWGMALHTTGLYRCTGLKIQPRTRKHLLNSNPHMHFPIKKAYILIKFKSRICAILEFQPRNHACLYCRLILGKCRVMLQLSGQMSWIFCKVIHFLYKMIVILWGFLVDLDTAQILFSSWLKF